MASKGLIAWFMHRGYHGLAIPTWERKIRVFANWFLNFALRRDGVGIIARDQPRASFEEFASRPKPATEAKPAVAAAAAAPAKAPARAKVASKK
jgi:NADH dehydrogenase